MTNEEARAWLEHHFDPMPDGTKQSEAVSLAIKALERPTGWIPCCERLPEEEVFVLVTYENMFKRRFVKMLKRVKDYWVDSNDYRHFYRSIVAWMPLPERYTESEEEE